MLAGVEPTAKSPAASLKAIKTRPGFVVEEMVCEPLVQDPIAMASLLVHEGSHYIQSGAGRSLLNFMAEFQAYSAQRRFLQAVAASSGRDAVPANLLWLLDADAAGVAAHISTVYPRMMPYLAAAYATPAGFNAAAAERDLLNLIMEEMLTAPAPLR